jgi:predicted RNase H-like HicB family nuclease
VCVPGSLALDAVPKKYREVRAALRDPRMGGVAAAFERADDDGWGAYLPDLPGVVGLGTGREEVADRIREALDAYAREMAGFGRPLPEPVATAETIQAA